MFNLIQELFVPGRRHTAEEQKRLELSRVDLNTGDPGRGPIDLTCGKVTVRQIPAPPSPGVEEAGAGAETAGTDDAPAGS